MILALVFLLACSGAPSPAHQQEVRKPANVMSAEGADWLERPEREAEERPDLVVAMMHLKNGDVVADIGAGSGYFSRRLARAVGPNGKVYANDIQPEMLDLLRRYAARDHVTNIVPVLGTETDPRLPKHAMDWLLLVDVYHEFQQPQVMLAKLRESLKPEGHVALVEYRAEGATAEHIRPEHRMSREQVLKEWVPAGFKLADIVESLPSQRVFIFTLH